MVVFLVESMTKSEVFVEQSAASVVGATLLEESSSVVGATLVEESSFPGPSLGFPQP